MNRLRLRRWSRRPRTRRALTCGTAAAVMVAWVPGIAATQASTQVPRYDHVFVVTLSGQSTADVIGPAAYLTSLAGANTLLADYAPLDPSPLADLMALTSGQTYALADCLPAQCSQGAGNIAAQLDAAGQTWAAYAESMPGPCSTTAAAGYAPERVPFLYYSDLAADCSTRVLPYTQLATDLAGDATTPALAWISPNTQDDMSTSVAQGDAWLQASLAGIFASPAWTTRHSLLVVVGDAAPAPAGNDRALVPAVLVSSDHSLTAPYRSTGAYDHRNLLSTIQSALGLTVTTAAPPIVDVFPGDAQQSQPAPTASATPPSNGTPNPSATPSATPTPTPTTTPGLTPSPTASGSATPSSPSPVATEPPVSATPGPNQLQPATPAPRPAAPSQPAPKLLSPTPGSLEFTLTSPAMTVTNLAYVGTSTVSSGSVTLTELTFTADAATLAGFTEDDPCTITVAVPSPMRLVHSIPATATATLSGPITLVATSLSYTPPGGPTVTFDAANLPPTTGVIVPSGTLPSVELTATYLSAASLSATALSVQVAAC